MCRSASAAYKLWIYSLFAVTNLLRSINRGVRGKRSSLSLSFSFFRSPRRGDNAGVNAVQCWTMCDTVTALSLCGESSSMLFSFNTRHLTLCLIRVLKISLADSVVRFRRTTCVDAIIQSRSSISCASMLTLT